MATKSNTVLSHGNTSDVYAIGVDAVAKVPRPGVPDHWIEIEACHAAAVHEAGLPTPMVLDVLEVNGRRAIVFERIDGPSMLEQLAATPDRVEAIARDMAAIQREFHSVLAPAALPDLRERVRGKIETASGVSSSERIEAQEVLEALPGGVAVCHGDMHPGNILIGSRGPMVIDWFDATAGAPVADIVRTSLIVRPMRSIPSSPPHLTGISLDVLERFHRTYVGCMLDELNVSDRSVLAWEAVLAVSRLAEPVGPEFDDLVAVWQSRADLFPTSVTPLAELLPSREPLQE